MLERPNFYVILDIDPNVDDWPTIEARILEKKRQWSKDMTTGNPSTRRRAYLYQSLYTTVESVMHDPVARKKEAVHARSLICQQNEAGGK